VNISSGSPSPTCASRCGHHCKVKILKGLFPTSDVSRVVALETRRLLKHCSNRQMFCVKLLIPRFWCLGDIWCAGSCLLCIPCLFCDGISPPPVPPGPDDDECETTTTSECLTICTVTRLLGCTSSCSPVIDCSTTATNGISAAGK
jgi:hypothetical protein